MRVRAICQAHETDTEAPDKFSCREVSNIQGRSAVCFRAKAYTALLKRCRGAERYEVDHEDWDCQGNLLRPLLFSFVEEK